MSKDLFAERYKPRTSGEDIDEAIEQFLENGGEVTRLKSPSKLIRDKNPKGGILLTTREERYKAD